MASLIPATRPQSTVEAPLTLTQLQIHVGGFIRFIDLMGGDMLVINEASLDNIGLHNPTASALAGHPIFGDVILCSPTEIA